MCDQHCKGEMCTHTQTRISSRLCLRCGALYVYILQKAGWYGQQRWDEATGGLLFIDPDPPLHLERSNLEVEHLTRYIRNGWWKGGPPKQGSVCVYVFWGAWCKNLLGVWIQESLFSVYIVAIPFLQFSSTKLAQADGEAWSSMVLLFTEQSVIHRREKIELR